jgi:hypothetical protein
MNIIIIVASVIGILIYFIIRKTCFTSSDPHENTERPPLNKKPSNQVPNNKIVLVTQASYDEIKVVITGFCNLYNNESFEALPKLTSLTDDEFIITFPYDIEFDLFCYFINYIKNPIGLEYKSKVIAWTTTGQAEGWVTEKSAHKKVMIFIPEDDKEGDNVFLTTDDNIGYKLGFAVGEEKQLLDIPKVKYFYPTIEIATLSSKQSENFS